MLQIVSGQVTAADSLMKNTWLSDFVRGGLVVVGGLSSYTHFVLGTLGQKAISPNHSQVSGWCTAQHSGKGRAWLDV